MRAHSARAALRALRLSQTAPASSRSAAPFRRLCAPTSSAVKESVVIVAPEAPVSSHPSEAPELSSAPATEVLETIPQPDASAAAEVSAAAAPAVAEEHDPAGGLEGDALGASSDSGEEQPTSERSSRAPSRKSLADFSTPEEMTEHFKQLIAHKGTRSAMYIFRDAIESSETSLLSSESVRLMLPLLARSGWFKSCQAALEKASSLGIKMSTATYNCALFSMTRTGDIEAIERTITSMLETRSPPNATSYNLLIASHFYAGTVDDAFAVLQTMKAADIYPSIATYHTLVSGCLRRKDHRRAYHTLMAIEQQGLTMSAMTVAQVLFAVANDDNFDQMAHLLGKLSESMPAYSADIDRVSAKRSMYAGAHTKTTHHHREAVRGAPRLELAAISAIMHSAARGGRPDIAVRAWHIVTEMYPELKHSSDHWYALIGALAGAGDFAAAFDAVGHMRAAGREPDVRSLTVALIRPLAADVHKIDEMYFRMVERLEAAQSGVTSPGAAETDEQAVEDAAAQGATEEVPLVETVEAEVDPATAGSNEAALDAEAEDVSEHVVELSNEDGDDAGDSPSARGEPRLCITAYDVPWASLPPAPVGITEFNCVIAACAYAGDLDRAFQTYDEACGRFALARDAHTLNALLEGCVQTRHLRGGARILEEARADGFAHETDTLKLAVRLLIRGRKGGEALEMLREARAAGTYVAPRTFQMLARQMARVGDMEAAEQVVELAVEAGFRASAVRPREERAPREDVGFEGEGIGEEAVFPGGEAFGEEADGDGEVPDGRSS